MWDWEKGENRRQWRWLSLCSLRRDWSFDFGKQTYDNSLWKLLFNQMWWQVQGGRGYNRHDWSPASGVPALPPRGSSFYPRSHSPIPEHLTVQNPTSPPPPPTPWQLEYFPAFWSRLNPQSCPGQSLVVFIRSASCTWIYSTVFKA